MKDGEAAGIALERSGRKLRPTPSAIVEASEIVSKSAPMTDDFEVALGAITAKLELIVRIGDTVTQVAMFLCPRSSTQNCSDSSLCQHGVESAAFGVQGSSHIISLDKY
jgi:hypothetical protein